MMHGHVLRKLLQLAVIGCLGTGSTTYGLDPFTGFETLAWGASTKEVQSTEKRRFVRKVGLDPNFSEYSEEGRLVGMVLAAPVVQLVYQGTHSEKVHYFISNDKLTAVIYRPGTNMSFRPHKIMKTLKETYGDKPKEDKTIIYPSTYGQFDKELEYPLTLDWDNNKGRVRALTRVWTPLDMRQVFAVMYSSKEMNDLATKRLAELEAARLRAAEADRKESESKTVAPPANP